MKVTFSINYHTRWGESLYLCGDIPALGGGDTKAALSMNYKGDDIWELALDLPASTPNFNYRYIVEAKDKAWRMEWGDPHRYEKATGVKEYHIHDAWHDMPSDKPYYSSAFVDGMLHRSNRQKPVKPRAGELNLRVEAPMIAADEMLAIVGANDALGNWNVEKALPLCDANYPQWEINLPLSGLNFPVEYKFLIIKKDGGDVVAWENGANRTLNFDVKNPRTTLIAQTGLRFVNPLSPWKGAGTAIPVFSLRSESDFGVGDFLDLKKMIDWCAMTGQKILQILPINDTTATGTWTDSYPYSAISTFALHPMYINLHAVGKLSDKAKMEHYVQMASELNQLPELDYERVNDGKIAYLKDIFAETDAATSQKKEYKKFVAANEYWLKPYAAFCTLRDFNGTPDMSRWGEFATYDADKIDKFCAKYPKEIRYVYFVQYHLDKQLRETRDYAHSKGVVLKGDIPIGISRMSVDAWVYPQLFHLNTQAGAPPDDFSVLGQNWGFPTYNWDEMARDGFSWWKARFQKMAEYFDAYRIDHVLGFFRIWQIPLDAVHGLLGVFHPALPLSADEIRREFDFGINPSVQTTPLILEWMLTDFFGQYAGEVKEQFLVSAGGDRYFLQTFVDTQVKVEQYFASQEKNDRNSRIRDGLLGLIDNVLFIEDPYEPGKYHPRISGQQTYQYRCLSDYERWCYNRLYDNFFYHRHNDFWYGKAMWKLPPLIDATKMLCCAEDLGMIPDCVPAVMDQLRILSLEIQRMPKDPKVEFANTWAYPYYSVCTTSTHDMPGIRGWWESDHDMAQRYFNQVLHEGGQAPYFAEPWICDKITDLQLNSPSMLCILPLQDWLSIDGTIRRQNPADEQINIPAISKHYWRYRMHLTLEDLIAHTTFNDAVSRKISNSGR